MVNRTAWTPGVGAGLTLASNPLFGAADLTSLANGSAVLSSNADIANATNLDQWVDVAVSCTIASSAIPAGANFALFLYELMNNVGGTFYGDGQLTAGTQTAYIAGGIFPIATIPLRQATYTNLAGYAQGIIIPPGSFRFVLLNNTGVALSATAANNIAQYRCYNQNLNN